MSKVVIGIDQSYTRTGITVLYDKKIIDMIPVDFPQCKTNNEKRIYLESMLENIIDYVKHGGVIEETFQELVPDDIRIIVERIRLKSQGFLNQSYIMSTGALIASIVRIAEHNNVPVYSVDTRSWKSQIVGSSKPLENKYGINPEKYRTILYMRDRGLLKYIAEPYDGRGKKGVINVKMDGKKVHCKINDDLADSYCIALYGFLSESKQKLKKEEF